MKERVFLVREEVREGDIEKERERNVKERERGR